MLKRSEVYLMAAELVQDGADLPSCTAISCVVDYSRDTERRDYNAMFKPSRAAAAAEWGRRWSLFWDERKDCRILALLFMSQIAKDEERSKR